MMETALRKVGVAVKLVRVPGGGHGAAGASWDKIDWAGLTVDWFNSHLRQDISSAAALKK
jgi:dipeptidyl aminopeptidase/acylaminoacyl peptidase